MYQSMKSCFRRRPTLNHNCELQITMSYNALNPNETLTVSVNPSTFADDGYFHLTSGAGDVLKAEIDRYGRTLSAGERGDPEDGPFVVAVFDNSGLTLFVTVLFGSTRSTTTGSGRRIYRLYALYNRIDVPIKVCLPSFGRLKGPGFISRTFLSFAGICIQMISSERR